ncbi:MAG: hypothetical protein SGPRY_012914, partial [Prymnesium sp.]
MQLQPRGPEQLKEGTLAGREGGGGGAGGGWGGGGEEEERLEDGGDGGAHGGRGGGLDGQSGGGVAGELLCVGGWERGAGVGVLGGGEGEGPQRMRVAARGGEKEAVPQLEARRLAAAVRLGESGLKRGGDD